MKTYVLYNPKAGSGAGRDAAMKLRAVCAEELEFRDITAIESYADFFDRIGPSAKVILAGGDGTLNRFLNDTAEAMLPNPIYYYAVGGGNDFLRDLGLEKGAEPVCIDLYRKKLPLVEAGGHTYRFLNGVGYGIDGYCCEKGDALRDAGGKKINYTAIAIKGLLFHYKPANAVVTVDGVRHEFRKVWLAPTMNGRFYGGGMMPTPAQDRLGEDGAVSVMVMQGSGKLRTLAIFPSIFSGRHVSHAKCVHILNGHEITVRFDQPRPLQIDGETLRSVTEYTVHAGASARESATAWETNCPCANAQGQRACQKVFLTSSQTRTAVLGSRLKRLHPAARIICALLAHKFHTCRAFCVLSDAAAFRKSAGGTFLA